MRAGWKLDLASKESIEAQMFKEKNAQCYLLLFSKTSLSARENIGCFCRLKQESNACFKYSACFYHERNEFDKNG